MSNQTNLGLDPSDLRQLMGHASQVLAKDNAMEKLRELITHIREGQNLSQGEMSVALVMHAAIASAAATKEGRLDHVEALSIQVIQDVFETAREHEQAKLAAVEINATVH